MMFIFCCPTYAFAIHILSFCILIIASLSLTRITLPYLQKLHAVPTIAKLCLPTFPRQNVSVHCREEGCIGKYTPRGPRDFPRAGILHPEAREIRGPRAAKSPPEGNLEGRGGCIFQCIPTRGSVRTFFQN